MRCPPAAAVTCLALAASLGGAPSALVAQEARAGPFLPLGSRLDRLVAWTIADGALPDVNPLARPYRLAAVRSAVAKQDTTVLEPAARRALAWLRDELAAFDAPTVLGAEVAQAAYHNGRRDTFRPGGKSGDNTAGGIFAAMSAGPFVGVVNPAFEGRLWDDPEYTGEKHKRLAGRNQAGYLALTGERGDLVFGRMARDWGPGLFDGLLVSPSAYAFETLAGALRIGRFELSAIEEQLDPGPDTIGAAGVTFNRYFFAHRLTINAGKGVWIALSETGVYGGAGQGFRLAFVNPLNLALLSEVNDSLNVNILAGLDVTARPWRRVQLSASLFLDDIQLDQGTLRDKRPTSYGFTGVARYSVPDLPVHLSLGYTRISSLAYRNEKDVRFGYTLKGIGIGRNFSDYDQWLFRAEAQLGPLWYVAADLSYLRQGSGDFRLPFPSDSVLALGGQGFLVAPVHRAVGARVTFSAEPRPGFEIRAEIGTTQNPQGGVAQPILGVSAHLRMDLLSGKFGGAVPAIEPGANRAWP